MDQNQLTNKAIWLQHKLLWSTALIGCLAAISIGMAFLSVCIPRLNMDLPTFIVMSLISFGLTFLSALAFSSAFIIKYNIFNNNRLILYFVVHKPLGIAVLLVIVFGIFALDAFVLPYANYERFRKHQRPIFMFTSSLLRYKDGGSQRYFGITYNILYYNQESSNGLRIGPRLDFNFNLPFRDQEIKEEVQLRKYNSMQ